MDLFEAIQSLYEEKASLMRAISALEELQQSSIKGVVERKRSKRGRKSMNSDERQEVSKRMKNYWASRRFPPAEKGQR